MYKKPFVTAVALSALFFGCKIRSTPNDTKLKVVGGEMAKKGSFPASFYIPSCSAVRVSNSHFLTAAHCVLAKPQWQLLDHYKPGATLPIHVGIELSSAKAYFTKVKQVKVHRSYKNLSEFGGDLSLAEVVDIALVEVENLPQEIALATFGDISITPGIKVVFTGYGCEVIPAYMRRGSNHEFLARGELNEDEKKLRLKFKEVSVLDLESHVAMIANIHSNSDTIEFQNTQDKKHEEFSGCPGDSGSAVYRILESGTSSHLEILGINSYINQYRSVFARLDKEAPNSLLPCLNSNLSASKTSQLSENCFESM